MQKNKVIKSLVVLLALVIAMPIFAAGVIRVVVNGERVMFPDAQPYMDSNNRVLIPVRFVSEELGAKVNWNKNTKTVTIVDNNNTVVLVVGEKKMKVNGVTKQLDTKAIIKNTRTFVPLRFVSEALGATVEWDSKGKSVYINNNGKPIVKEKVVESLGFSVPLGDSKECKQDEMGYSITMNSMLEISLHNAATAKKGGVVLLATLSRSYSTGDFDKQCQETEELLSQKFSSSTVKNIMAYVKKKDHVDTSVPEKHFYEGIYDIEVSAKSNGPANVYVMYKQ